MRRWISVGRLVRVRLGRRMLVSSSDASSDEVGFWHSDGVLAGADPLAGRWVRRDGDMFGSGVLGPLGQLPEAGLGGWVGWHGAGWRGGFSVARKSER